MFNFFRKHRWLLIVVMSITAATFVYWGVSPATRGGGGRSNNFGSIYGREITAETYEQAKREFYMFYWLHYGEWPNKRAGVTAADMDRETYIRLLIAAKAKSLGIHVNDDALATAAAELLRSLGRNGQSVPMDQFVTKVLQPEGMTVQDLQNYLRSDLTVQQTIMTLGLAGSLVTPQEASALYDREHQEVSAQAVFFSASNYLSQVTVTPTAVADFYAKNMAAYREPDRVSVSYVVFDLSNYLAAAMTKLGKTNLDNQVDAAFRQQGMEAVPTAKTPEEAKAKIKEFFIRQAELAEAGKVANDFATTLFALEPVKAENIAAVAQQKGIKLHTTAPFAATYGPTEFEAPAAFTKAAFALSTEQPFSEMITGSEAVYLLALNKQLPSSIPALEQIRERVTQNYRMMAAQSLAQSAGTNFYVTAGVQIGVGQTFVQVALAGNHTPVQLKPFSLSTAEIPEIGDRAELGQIKQAAFTTPVGQPSHFVSTSDGGFVLFVKAMQPMDMAKKTAELPQFLNQVRRGRQNEAFNAWLQSEANRELRNTPVYSEIAGAGSAK
jgi:peptidyl-prolyl cis-trans isomerase D